MLQRVLALLSSIGMVTAAQGPGSTELLLPIVEVPMDLSTQHISVEVLVNGEGPFSFNLDTYAVTTACVDSRFAERMRLKKVGTVLNGDGSGKQNRRDVVLIPELQFGDSIFKDVRALVDDYAWVSSPEGGSIDGLLGFHLFHDLLLELDYPRQRVVLRRGELSATDDQVICHPALRERPDFPLHIGDKRFIFGIDSGAQSGLSLPSAFIARLDLMEPPKVVGRAKTVYSESEIQAGLLADPLTFAGHEHRHINATFSELFGKPLIGHELLVNYAVTFDQQNGRVRFVKPD